MPALPLPRRLAFRAASTQTGGARSGGNGRLVILDSLSQAGAALQIVVVDLLLSADNAVVIALACRALEPQDRRRAYLAGTVGAVAMRLLFASAIVFVLQVPFLKLLGGAALVVIAIKLAADAGSATPGARAPGGLGLAGTIGMILVGDLAMSLDNIVAVAALANGSLWLLATGLAISIPLLVYGSALLNRLIGGSVALVSLAGMALGWIAGGIAVSDPAVAPWVAQQAPALAVTLPGGAALLVLWEATILRRRQRAANL